MKKEILLFFILVPIIVNAQLVTSSKDTTIEEGFLSVEVMPEYVGEEAACWKFINENLEYPAEAKKNKIKGKVHIKFTIDKDGSLKDFHVLNKNKLGYGCEEAAIEVLKKMPKWKPGRQNGEAVAVYFVLPIRFPPRR